MTGFDPHTIRITANGMLLLTHCVRCGWETFHSHSDLGLILETCARHPCDAAAGDSPTVPGLEVTAPVFACRVEMAWPAGDGSLPSGVSVAWQEMPTTEMLCRTIQQMATSGTVIDPPAGPDPGPQGFDRCARPSCGHYRLNHRDADLAPAGWSGGRCKICEESTPCPGFVTEAELLQEG